MATLETPIDFFVRRCDGRSFFVSYLLEGLIAIQMEIKPFCNGMIKRKKSQSAVAKESIRRWPK